MTSSRLVRRLRSEQSGAVLVLVTIAMLVMLLLAGLVIDFGGVRTYRADQQSISDAAASAGALAIADSGNGVDGCEAAKRYVIINSDSITDLSGIDCSTFPTACEPTTPEVTASTTDAGFTITLTYPVPDTSTLLASDIMGALPQPVVEDDGVQCDRFGVTIESDYVTGFTRLAGLNTLPADVHTVARSHIPQGEKIPINVLVLDRHGCQAIEVGGSGSAGVIVEAIYAADMDPDTPGDQPGLLQGLAAADSDAASGCSSNDGVIDIDGSNGIIIANGPQGCPAQIGTHTVFGLVAGEGCGRIRTVAPGTPGCNFPACTSAHPGYPLPDPTSLPRPLTRAPVDHRYNCDTGYATRALDPTLAWATEPLTVANEQDIPDCADTPAPHIYDLIAQVGPSGQPATVPNRWTDFFTCTQASSAPPINVTGSWWIDCPSLAVNNTVTITGGNVVFDGDVDIRASGILTIDNTAGPPGWAFLRDGEVKKAGQGTLAIVSTLLYASKTSKITMAGGSGGLTWIAPNSGPFDDLALWSDSPIDHKWAGQASLNMQGVFFTPWATAVYSGGAGQNQVNAQFVADKLEASGNGALVVAPAFGRAVEFPVEPQSVLIR